MPFPNYIGRKRLWTRERVTAGLAAAAEQIEGPLPCSENSYREVKKGRLDRPPASRILEYFGAISRGWLATGVPKRRVSLNNVPWTEEEREYLLLQAGRYTLEWIARRLGRSYVAMRGQLKQMGIASRHNQGFLSAADITREFDSPYNRVCKMLKTGRVRGRYDRKRNRWEVDPIDITPDIIELLGKPVYGELWERKYANPSRRIRVDYYRRYGLSPPIIEGRVSVVPL